MLSSTFVVCLCSAILGCKADRSSDADSLSINQKALEGNYPYCQCPYYDQALTQLQQQIDALKELHKNTSCGDIWSSGATESGIYTIFPFHDCSKSFEVYCDFTEDLPGWITFQRRMDGSLYFYLYWDDYVNGFGDMNTEFWLGLETLHQITSEKNYELRVDMEDFEGETRYAKYSTFKVGAAPGYLLEVSGYSGDAGDAMYFHDGMKFSTRDVKQDEGGEENCAQVYQGAWWYKKCHRTNPNGLYLGGEHISHADGVEWTPWHGYKYSLKRIEFKIRPRLC